MIVIYLQGGLGNQLFQYAFGRSLQATRGDELYIDVSSFQKAESLGETPRKLELLEFNTQFQKADAHVLNQIQNELHLPFLRRLRNKIVPYKRILVLNDHSAYPNSSISEREMIYLHGYFQKEHYFSNIKQLLLQELQINYTPLRKLQLPSQAVSVHVRRGDYVSLPAAASHHGTCSVEYYLNAMELMKSKLEQPHFIFFSDDIPWCKTTFGHLEHVQFMESIPGMRESEDMMWMSKCQHHIIANSSYSWWGAWLNTFENKIVVAPAKWNTKQTTPTNDYVPSSWIQLP